MMSKEINRIKVVLVDKKRTNKWLAEQLEKDPATVSKWCTNSAQPSLEMLIKIAKLLEVEVNELLRPESEHYFSVFTYMSLEQTYNLTFTAGA